MMIRVPTPQGEMPAYLALPRRPTAGVVVIQEIFGLTDSMKAVCDWLASRQLVALMPEVYWRTDPGVVLKESDVDTARACRAKVKDDDASDDIAAAMDFLRKHEMCTGRVGVVGYCWGGLLQFVTAVRHKPDAAVGYYPVAIETRLGDASKLTCPMMIHFGELDKYTPPEVIAQTRAAFQSDPRVTIYEYAGCNHAFARPGGANFQARAADLADMRTLSFFVEKLIGKR